MSTDTLPWVEKYRPLTLQHLVSNNGIVHKLTRLHARAAVPNLLFYGPPGTGKTSTILAYARTMHGEGNTGMLLELNASDERNIATIKKTVYQFVSNRTLLGNNHSARHAVKLVVLDEADAMTPDAQDALTHLMDRYARQVRFCLICNRISNVSAAVQSRCTKFRFAPLEPAQVRKAVQRVLDGERLRLRTPEVLNAILHVAHGDLRRCFNVLQACATLVRYQRADDPRLTAADIYTAIGQPVPAQLQQLMRHVIAAPTFARAYQYVRHFMLHEAISLDDLIRLWHNQLSTTDTLQQQQQQLNTHYTTLACIERRIQHNTNTYLNAACFVSAVRRLGSAKTADKDDATLTSHQDV